MPKIKAPSAINAAIGLLARREHSAQELRQKLQKKGLSKDDVAVAVLACQERGYQSDMRFCEQFCRLRIQQGYGPIRIEQELKARGIAAPLIELTVHGHTIDWDNIVLQLIQKKTKGKLLSNLQERLKIKRYLYYRGFPAELIPDSRFCSF